ncbi:hypothetical protein HY745_09955 [Candidatus Desantisbacteria bacterium]|nr:hypothetical protein [Candidatus Desantisbacteria bacterium]
MELHRVFEDRLMSTVKDLPTNKVVELINYAEYLKGKENWKIKFRAFLSKVENKLDNITEEDIQKEIQEVRANYGKKNRKA